MAPLRSRIHAPCPSAAGTLRASSLIVLVGVLAGILAADAVITPHWIARKPVIPALAGLWTIGLVAACVTRHLKSTTERGSAGWGALLAAGAFCAGVLAAQASEREKMIDERAGRESANEWRSLVGRVCDLRSVEPAIPGRSIVRKNTGRPGAWSAAAGNATGSRRVRSLTICAAPGRRPGRVRISLVDKPLDADLLHVGDLVLATGRTESPRPAQNPFGFDEAKWLASRGIHVVMTDPARIRTAHRHAGLQFRARAVRDRLRSRIDRRFDRREHRALAAAVLLGDRSDVDAEIRSRFVRSGLMHLLALSGLHIGMIGGIVFLTIDSVLRRLRLFGRPRRFVRSVLWTVSMAVYGTVVAWPVSVVRALVMAAAFLVASTSGRRCSPWHVWGIAASVLLLAAPGNLYSAGFQLSFAAVGGILLVRPGKDPHPAAVRDRGDTMRGVVSAARASAAAGVATMPILLFHFGSAPTAGILLSPPGILLIGPILASAVVSLCLPMAAAAPFAHVCSALMDALLALGSGGLDILPDIHHVPGQWTSAAAVPVIIGALLWVGGGRRRLRLLILSTLTAIGLLSMNAATSLRGPVHSIVFFSAGQGDAALARTAAGRTLLLDAAPGAARAVMDYGRATHMDRIDTVVLTHNHQDHSGGLEAITRELSVGRLIHTGWIEPGSGRRARVVSAGDTVGLGPGIRIDVLNPESGQRAHGNDESIVLLVRIGHVEALFMGDAESNAEARILARYGPLLDVDVVKAGHHGSATSSTESFIRASRPRFVLISAGRNNRFDHPSARIVRRWHAAGAVVHVTSERGALVLETNGLDLRVGNR